MKNINLSQVVENDSEMIPKGEFRSQNWRRPRTFARSRQSTRACAGTATRASHDDCFTRCTLHASVYWRRCLSQRQHLGVQGATISSGGGLTSIQLCFNRQKRVAWYTRRSRSLRPILRSITIFIQIQRFLQVTGVHLCAGCCWCPPTELEVSFTDHPTRAPAMSRRTNLSIVLRKRWRNEFLTCCVSEAGFL